MATLIEKLQGLGFDYIQERISALQIADASGNGYNSTASFGSGSIAGGAGIAPSGGESITFSGSHGGTTLPVALRDSLQGYPQTSGLSFAMALNMPSLGGSSKRIFSIWPGSGTKVLVFAIQSNGTAQLAIDGPESNNLLCRSTRAIVAGQTTFVSLRWTSPDTVDFWFDGNKETVVSGSSVAATNTGSTTPLTFAVDDVGSLRFEGTIQAAAIKLGQLTDADHLALYLAYLGVETTAAVPLPVGVPIYRS